MTSFILFGVREDGGFRHVDRDEIRLLPDGVPLHVDRQDIFMTTDAYRDASRKGLVIGPPGWEHRLNDLVAGFLARGVASDALAQELFISLARDERQALVSSDVRGVVHQRVREAVLGFNLLAVGSTWRPAVREGLPYWSRDWVAWCDRYIAEFERGRSQYAQIGSFVEARQLEHERQSLEAVRAAFATSPMVARAPRSGGGCYIATSVYGSYEAPEVRTLRRWRDERLMRSVMGRGLVRFYYATSPCLVRAVGGRRWFRVPMRGALDAFVRRLEGRR